MTVSMIVASSGGSIVDLDATIFIQLAIFFVALAALRSLVFRPMVRLFEAREEAIDGAREQARERERAARDKGRAFDAEMRRIRMSAAEQRDRLRDEGLRLQREILEQGRSNSRQRVEEATANLEAERKKIVAGITKAMPSLAAAIGDRLAGRELQ